MHPELLSNNDRSVCFKQSDANKLRTLGNTIQSELFKLQNPPNCSTAKKLVLKITQKNGFAGIMHFVAHALMFAYGTHRTLVLKPTNMAYGEGAWEEYVEPLSNTCVNATGDAVISNGGYSGRHKKAPVVELRVQQYRRIPGFTPPLIPRHILTEFAGVDCDPAAWWTGQIMRYVFRPKHRMTEEIRHRMETFTSEDPIVGLHIRRGDKLRADSGKHEVEEYMREVERYFDVLDTKQRLSARRVYVATDNAKVLDEITNKYPNYTILFDRGNAKSGGGRRTVSSLAGIVIDQYLLSQTDFLVCTFSSGVCRAAYELMVSHKPERCGEVRSLDCNFYFYKHVQLPMVANSDHTSSSPTHEIAFRKGDLIYSYGILGEGYSAGVNLNDSSGFLGVYPSHKTDIVHVPDKFFPVN